MFKWKDYLQLSREWKDIEHTNPLSEAYCRSAISRAYYCVYHNVKSFAMKNGFTPDPKRQGDRHAELVEYLNNNKRSWAGGYLKRLKKNRHISDYDNNKEIDYRFVNTSLHFAANILGDISK